MLIFAWDRVKGTFKNGIACVTDEVIKNFAKYTFVIAMVYQDSFLFFYFYFIYYFLPFLRRWYIKILKVLKIVP